MLIIIASLYGCKKETDEDNSAIIYKNIDLTIPLTKGFVYTFEPKDQYKTEITFWYTIDPLDSTNYIAEFAEHYRLLFQCNGTDDYTNTANLGDSIVPVATNTTAYKFLEAKVEGGTITYANTNNIKFDQEVYIPFYGFLYGSQKLPYVGWLRIKCTQTELHVYDLAFRRTGSIKTGEK